MLSEVAVALGKTAPVSFRVNPDVYAGTHRKISTGKAENKFGVPISRALDAYALAARLPGLDPLGVAVHIGSQLTQLGPMEAAFARVGELIGELRAAGHDRSEEHTSELQSLMRTSYAVFCLKKKSIATLTLINNTAIK